MRTDYATLSRSLFLSSPPLPSPPSPHSLIHSLTHSLLSATATHHSANLPEVDEKFSELLSRELSHRMPTTSRKFRDVNAIRAARAAHRRPDFAYLHSRVSPEFIGRRFANCCENLSVAKKFLSRTCARTAHYQRLHFALNLQAINDSPLCGVVE